MRHVVQRQDAVDRAVEERPVVRDDEHRAGIARQVVLQPFERDDVEVVGRLVEEQQVGLDEQQPRQPQPRLLPAAERCHEPRLIDVGQAQPGQHGIGVGAQTLAARRLELGQGAVVLGQHGVELIARRLGDGLGQPRQPRLGRLALAAGSSAQHVAHRRSRAELERLRQIADAQRRGRKLDAAPVGRHLAGQDAQQRGLAAAVRPDQPGAVAAVQVEVDPVQHFHIAEPFGDIADLKHNPSPNKNAAGISAYGVAIDNYRRERRISAGARPRQKPAAQRRNGRGAPGGFPPIAGSGDRP